ncbi:MAG: hypothetical protein DLM57_10655 [Pseudonocardiales bacterium]|nr:MAG: hypothetical protein DLM57_10655 [Pseudonocardiales bacterium]
MRWDALFSDLAAQADELERAERAATVEERARIEVGALGLWDRLRPAVGCALRLECAGTLSLTGVLRRVGPDWLLLDEGQGREVVVAIAAIHGVSGLSRLSAVPDSAPAVESRLGLRHVLRGIARDRSPVRICRVDGSTVAATIDRVGADFLEAAVHPAGETRRRADVREVALIPYAALAAVRRDA